MGINSPAADASLLSALAVLSNDHYTLPRLAPQRWLTAAGLVKERSAKLIAVAVLSLAIQLSSKYAHSCSVCEAQYGPYH